MADRVAAHVAAFNDAVRTSDWAGFALRFAPDARMSFVGVPVGPFEGRAAIEAAYRANPPTDTMTLGSGSTADTTDLVPFRWDAGGTGIMALTWDADGFVAELQIEFD